MYYKKKRKIRVLVVRNYLQHVPCPIELLCPIGPYDASFMSVVSMIWINISDHISCQNNPSSGMVLMVLIVYYIWCLCNKINGSLVELVDW